jgi:hypothetical protein
MADPDNQQPAPPPPPKIPPGVFVASFDDFHILAETGRRVTMRINIDEHGNAVDVTLEPHSALMAAYALIAAVERASPRLLPVMTAPPPAPPPEPGELPSLN